MNANEHGFVLAKFQPPAGERIVECENGEFILHCDHAQITKKLEENNLELARQNSALQLSQDNIINALGITGDGPVSKLVIDYVLGLVAERDALAAENACLKQDIDTIAEVMETGTDGALFSAIDEAVGLNTPATDSVLARIKAQGVDEAALTFHENAFVAFENSSEYGVYIRADLQQFAANLRAGRKG